MNITVKAAHAFLGSSNYQRLVRDTVINNLHEIPFDLAIRVLRDTEDEGHNCSAMNKAKLYDWNYSGERLRLTSPSVTLRVEPTLTIGALKSLVEPEPWIPKENLVLVQRKKRPLEDDNATLSECGFKDRGGTLLACMGGSFSVNVRWPVRYEGVDIPISSCFETLGVLKEKIHDMTGFLLEDHKLKYNGSYIRKKDNTCLVALGMVRPYSSDMPKKLNRICLNRNMPY